MKFIQSGEAKSLVNDGTHFWKQNHEIDTTAEIKFTLHGIKNDEALAFCCPRTKHSL